MALIRENDILVSKTMSNPVDQDISNLFKSKRDNCRDNNKADILVAFNAVEITKYNHRKPLKYI